MKNYDHIKRFIRLLVFMTAAGTAPALTADTVVDSISSEFFTSINCNL